MNVSQLVWVCALFPLEMKLTLFEYNDTDHAIIILRNNNFLLLGKMQCQVNAFAFMHISGDFIQSDSQKQLVKDRNIRNKQCQVLQTTTLGSKLGKRRNAEKRGLCVCVCVIASYGCILLPLHFSFFIASETYTSVSFFRKIEKKYCSLNNK